MSTNATTWFYSEPETNRPYYITERLTHTFWANRLSGIYLNCVKADAPYRVEGAWEGQDVAMEWEVRNFFRLISDKETKPLITVCSEVLGFRPTLSYVDGNDQFVTEWFLNKEHDRLREVQGDPSYRNVKKYR